MFLHRALSLAFAGAMLAGCAANGVPGVNAAPGANSSASLRSFSRIAPDSTPVIKSVSKIQAEQTQKIVIRGKGFGTMQPYNGDSCCIEFIVTNPACYYYGSYGTWQAGYASSNPNLVTLNVKKWSKREIIVTGFTGDYGQRCWTLNSGEPISLNVWNAQTLAGPATWSGTIQ
jgi:hypothetical protein